MRGISSTNWQVICAMESDSPVQRHYLLATSHNESGKMSPSLIQTLFHGSSVTIEHPEIRRSPYTKDFSWGFYCTNHHEQARRWAIRNAKGGYVNRYRFQPSTDLKILQFSEVNEAWLNFIARCRSGRHHDYDLVEGPMADDSIWNFVNSYLAGDIPKSVFLEFARFRHPTHQISFHTEKALRCLTFLDSEAVQ